MNVTIDPKLKTKCPRTALGCVTARVEPGASPAALLEEMKARETEIQKLAMPRSVLASPQVESTRMAYKALGKDPSRYRGSAEALLRRVVAGKIGRASCRERVEIPVGGGQVKTNKQGYGRGWGWEVHQD